MDQQKQILLTLTPEQAAAISMGLDTYFRLCIGQIQQVSNLVSEGVIPVFKDAKLEREEANIEACNRIENLMLLAKNELGYHANGSNGIRNAHVHISAKRAYEVQRALGKALADLVNPVPNDAGLVRYTKDPLPSATIISQPVAELDAVDTVSDEPSVHNACVPR